MDRARFEELKEFYALSALDDRQRGEFEEYLQANPEHQAEVDDLMAVGDLLALSPEELDPPASLRRNIMATVEAESRATRGTSRRAARRPWLERVGGFAGVGRVALGAAAAVLVGVLSWNTITQRDEIQNLRSALDEQQIAQGQDSRDSANQTIELEGSATTGEVEVVRLDGRRAVLVAEGLPPMDEGKALQLWVIKDDVPKPAGVFKPGDKLVSIPVEGSLEDADMVAVTVEPAGGSPAPTTSPTLSAKL